MTRQDEDVPSHPVAPTATARAVAPARVLVWGLVIIALVVAAGVAIVVLQRTSDGIRGFGRRAEPVVTQQVVVQRLREVAKLVATEMTLRDVVIYEERHLLSTKRMLLVVTGRVSAGIDLQENDAAVQLDSAARHITIALQPARIVSVEVLNVTTYDERAGLLNPFTPEDRDVIQRRIRVQLEESARQSGILAHADESAARALTALLTRDGYTVEITRPLVVRRPAT